MRKIYLRFNEFIVPDAYQSEINYSNRKNYEFKKSKFTIFYVLLLIQVLSTCLMLFALPFTIQGVSAESQIKQSRAAINSGNPKNDKVDSNSFGNILNRYKRKRELKDQSLKLTKSDIDSICDKSDFVSRFKFLSNYRLETCDLFDLISIIYSFITKSYLTIMSENVTFPHSDITVSTIDHDINAIPSKLFILENSGNILVSNVSVQNLIIRHFSTSAKCRKVLMEVTNVDEEIRNNTVLFDSAISKNHCIGYITESQNSSSQKKICNQCKLTYKNWLCTHKFDLFTSIILHSNSSSPQSKPPTQSPSSPSSSSSSSSSRQDKLLQYLSSRFSVIIGVKSCPNWCSLVETNCPYFTPVDSNGGEPAFLCDESHYHHSTRYRIDKNEYPDCGGDLPWSYCCYSSDLLVNLQLARFNTSAGYVGKESLVLSNTIWSSSSSLQSSQLYLKRASSQSQSSESSSCTRKHKNCLLTVIKSIFQVFFINQYNPHHQRPYGNVTSGAVASSFRLHVYSNNGSAGLLFVICTVLYTLVT